MSELPDWLAGVVVALIGTGGMGAILQARTSRQIGVREHDVAEEKNSGDLALELVRIQAEQIKRLEEGRDRDHAAIDEQEKRGRRLEAVLTRINAVLAETVTALDDLIYWQASGAVPPPPWRLEDIRARLARLLPKEDKE
ncbi:hypothetical protein [Brachybacterium nesterenkovii]|uniref:hypothetical protein n=1 Tax=Brachybacterium nesterenkovii TaxID=47847 RepID=UPI00321A3C71